MSVIKCVLRTLIIKAIMIKNVLNKCFGSSLDIRLIDIPPYIYIYIYIYMLAFRNAYPLWQKF